MKYTIELSQFHLVVSKVSESRKNIQHGSILLVIAILVFIVLIFRYGIIPGYQELQSDFPNYYTASKMFADNDNLQSIYDNRMFKIRAVKYGIPNQIVSFVPHSPPTMILYQPVVYYEPITAKRVWIAANIVFLALSVFILSRTFRIPVYLCIALTLSLTIPIANNFLFGQAYIFILMLTSFGLYLWKAKRFFLSGLLIGIGASVKPFGLFFIIPAILHKRWLFLPGILVGFAIPMLIVYEINPEIFYPYMKWVLPATLHGEIQNPYVWDFRSYTVILRNLFIYDPARNPDPLIHSPFHFVFWRTLAALLILHFFAVIQLRSKNSGSITEIDSVSTILIASLLIAPVTSSYQYVLLLPAILVLTRHFNRYWFAIILNMHVFFIFSVIVKIPFIELIYMIFLMAMCYRAMLSTESQTQARKLAVSTIPIIILAFICGFLLTDRYKTHDNAEYVSDIQISGFPDELTISGENIIFTEMHGGNYAVNLNNRIFALDDTDMFRPRLMHEDDPSPFFCLSVNNIARKSKTVAIAFDDDEYWFEDLKPPTIVRSPYHKGHFRLYNQSRSSSLPGQFDTGYIDIYLFLRYTSGSVRLTHHPARDYSPAFYTDPDTGKEYVYFISERGGGLNDGRIYRIDITNIINDYWKQVEELSSR